MMTITIIDIMYITNDEGSKSLEIKYRVFDGVKDAYFVVGLPVDFKTSDVDKYMNDLLMKIKADKDKEQSIDPAVVSMIGKIYTA